MSEDSLSSKIKPIVINGNWHDGVLIEDVKEFIKQDWKLFELYFEGKIRFQELMVRRNKLIGEALI